MNQIDRLMKMKERVSDAKAAVSRLEGKLESMYEVLENDFGCDTVDEADKKLRDTIKRLDEKEDLLKKGIEELEDKHIWEE